MKAKIPGIGPMGTAAVIIVWVSGCAADPRPIEYGNPTGYTVHTLWGDSLSTKEVTLNGVVLDPSNTDAIEASVQAMIASTQAPRTVEELGDGRAADLHIDFTAAARPLPAHFYGGDMQWYSKYFLRLPSYRALVRHIRVDRLRFPAGLERGQYDRTATTSPADDLGDENFRLTGEDVANYIDLCREMNIAAEPQINLYVDNPSMWHDMVDQIVTDLGYDLQFLSAGNEPDLFGPRSPWSLFCATTIDEALATYADRYLRDYQAIAAVKPGLTVSSAIGRSMCRNRP